MTTADQAFAEALAARAGAGGDEPDFLRALRAAGRETFLRVNLPTPRLEDWRYTSLAPAAFTAFGPAPAARAPLEALPPAPRLVLAGGRVDRRATDLAGLPGGVRVTSLAAALRERPAALAHLLGQAVPVEGHAFAALNAALFEDGALVEVDAGVACAPALHLVFLSAGEGGPVASFPRTLVVAGEGSRLTVVEHHRGEGVYLSSAVTELFLGPRAEVEHDRLQDEAPAAVHVGLLQVTQEAASTFTGGSMALGGRIARVEARALLRGEGASCALHGLSVGGGEQLLDHWVHVDHASPRCTSRQTFKAVLDGRSRGVFAGRIHVRQDAQKTDAGQVSSSLLLSDDAVVDAKPQLEILADDVKCSHGGTVGQLRPEQLFYLRARGLPEAMARALLTWAFASEVVQRLGPPAVRDDVRRRVAARLGQGELLREAE